MNDDPVLPGRGAAEPDRDVHAIRGLAQVRGKPATTEPPAPRRIASTLATPDEAPPDFESLPVWHPASNMRGPSTSATAVHLARDTALRATGTWQSAFLDDAAGDSRPRVACGLSLEVIGILVHDHGLADDIAAPPPTVITSRSVVSVALPLASATSIGMSPACRSIVVGAPWGLVSGLK